MKNFLIPILVVLGLTSCSKDSLDLSTDKTRVPEKSEIMIRVSSLTWIDELSDSGCGGTNNQEVSAVKNASVKLYESSKNKSDSPNTLLLSMQTDQDGNVLIENLDPGSYSIIVKSNLGEKSRNIITQLNKRSFIEFSF